MAGRPAVIQGSFPFGFRAAAQTAVQPVRAGAAQAAAGAGTPTAMPVPPHLLNVSGGRPLPPLVRQKMEALFGGSFADVRVHVGGHAASIGAVAFTAGSHIHFAPGHYDPATPRGQQILGRELAHVIQQRSGAVRNPFGGGVAAVHDPRLEAEADQIGRLVTVQAAALQRKAAGLGSVVQRDQRYEERVGKGTMEIVDSVAGRITATSSKSDKVSELKYTINSAASEVVISHVASHTRGAGSGMMYHLALIAKREGVKEMHTTLTAFEAHAFYESCGFAPDAEWITMLLSNGVTDPGQLKNTPDWYALVSTVERNTSNRFFQYWKVHKSCLLTTACVRYMGLPDHCRELAVLRELRDTFLASTETGRALVDEYYALAPHLVAAIDASPAAPRTYEAIYAIVGRCVEAASANQPDRAVELYRGMVQALSDQYRITPAAPSASSSPPPTRAPRR